MNYCSNCGNELEVDAKFCGECGVNLGNTPQSSSNNKRKSIKGLLVIGILILLAIGALMYNLGSKTSGEEVVTQELSIRDAVEWVEDEEKIEEFQGISIEEFDALTVKEVFEHKNVREWKAGKNEENEYLYVAYIDIEINYEIIINITNTVVQEIYIQNVLCPQEQVEKIVDEITEEALELQINFIGKSGAYSKISAYMNVQVEDKVVNVEIMVAEETETMTGEITEEKEAVVYLESGEPITLTWKDDETFTAEAKSGFDKESIASMRLICDALNGQEYTFESEKLYVERPAFLAKYAPVDGNHTNSNDGARPNTYSVRINEVGDNWFVFSVTENFDSRGSYVDNTVIESGVATFQAEKSAYAYYDDGKIKIKFECPTLGEMTITGYEPMTRISSYYFNPSYLFQ